MTKSYARTFGQDLMRGEHVVGGGMRSTTAGPKTIGTTEWMREKGLKGGCSDGDPAVATGTSIFDPVLTELAYRWFCPPGGHVLDPFAGGSVRGIVAAHLGRRYTGIDLSGAQVQANMAQLDIAPAPAPVWIHGDSADVAQLCAGEAFDFIFSCPPYANLEVYSDDPRDISNMEYPAFLAAYREIIAAACGLLMPDRFACFVVGEVRDKRGNYYNFIGDTVEAFRAAGMHYYNELILVTAVGSLPVRVGRQFKAGRKIGKTHQNILVFVKGDGKRAAQNIESSAPPVQLKVEPRDVF